MPSPWLIASIIVSNTQFTTNSARVFVNSPRPANASMSSLFVIAPRPPSLRGSLRDERSRDHSRAPPPNHEPPLCLTVSNFVTPPRANTPAPQRLSIAIARRPVGQPSRRPHDALTKHAPHSPH